jgi:hypothetical protein
LTDVRQSRRAKSGGEKRGPAENQLARLAGIIQRDSPRRHGGHGEEKIYIELNR